jgi:hypothetical protein
MLNKVNAKFEELFGIDIRALALMRIGFCVCILIQLADHLPYLEEFYSDAGILPRAYAIHLLAPNAICLNLMSGSWAFQALLFFLLVIFTIGLLLGWRTQLCTLMVWILLSSFHNRNWFLLGAEDKLMHILFFWFLFIPWGACYSIDSRRSGQNPPPPRVSSMGSVAYLVQICSFYTFAGFLKTDHQWTVQGNSLYYALNLDEFIKPLGHALLQHPLLLQQLTFSTLWLERWGALFFFIPFKNAYFRVVTVVAFMLLHIGIMLCMELRLFQWICLVMLLGFLPTSFLNRIFGKYSPRSNSTTANSLSIWKPNLFRMPTYLSIIVAFFITYTLFWNIGELRKPLLKIPSQLRWIGYTFNIYQHWGMFAPRSMIDDGWCVMPGKLRNGDVVDVFNSGAPVTWQEPDSIEKLNKLYDLTLYYLNIRHNENSYYRKPWAEYICNEWNSSHSFDKQLLSLDIDFMEKDTPPPGHPKPIPRRVLLISHDCFGHNVRQANTHQHRKF